MATFTEKILRDGLGYPYVGPNIGIDEGNGDFVLYVWCDARDLEILERDATWSGLLRKIHDRVHNERGRK